MYENILYLPHFTSNSQRAMSANIPAFSSYKLKLLPNSTQRLNVPLPKLFGATTGKYWQ